MAAKARDKASTRVQEKPGTKSTRATAAVTKAASGTDGRRRAARVKTAVTATSDNIAPEQRHRMVAEAAYYRAERRGFRCRCDEQDWFDAAAEIDRILKRP